MSHKATAWLAQIDPSLLKAGEFRVLFHLCDFHNSEKDPRLACYPSQETLKEKTALSNAGLNKILNSLEKAGHLVRKKSTIPGTSTRRTYYLLACDSTAEREQTLPSGDCPNSTPVEAGKKQTPLFDGANSTFGRSKLHPSGEEPVKEPVSNHSLSSRESAPVREAHSANEKTSNRKSDSKQNRKRRLPEGWVPSEKNIADAKSKNLTEQEIKNEAERFRDYHRQHGSAFADWDAAWRNWLRKAEEFASRSASKGADRRQNRPDPALEQIARLSGLEETSGNGGY